MVLSLVSDQNLADLEQKLKKLADYDKHLTPLKSVFKT